jgi:polyvinyl alcohol dehydrogenase (cytochrome)
VNRLGKAGVWIIAVVALCARPVLSHGEPNEGGRDTSSAAIGQSVKAAAPAAATEAAAKAASPTTAPQKASQQDPAGAIVFQKTCAACHLSVKPADPGTTASAVQSLPLESIQAPSRDLLAQFAPEIILNTLTNGTMQAQAATLTPAERRAVAAYAAGRDFGPPTAFPETLETNFCTERLLMGDPKTSPSWNGWGNGPQNVRFQPKSEAKLTPQDLPRLELKWAFGYANVSSARPQPTVVGRRLFAPSENGLVYALDARTGCRYWTYRAKAGIPTAIVAGPYHDAAGNTGLALFFGDRKANAYALDAQTGHEIWVRKVETHPSAAISGALGFDGTRVFVPVGALNEEGRGGLAASPCCTFRGSVSALDASTGVVLWKTYTVDASSPRRVPSQDGAAAFGPAGGGIQSVPTVDSKRRLVYVATGNSYADPPQLTTDAVLALDVNTGEIKWSKQMTLGDDSAPQCKDGDSTCPQTPSADFDLSAPPALVRAGDRDLLVLPQQTGVLWALDPEKSGEIVWQYRIGQGSGSGRQWGVAIESDQVYVGVAGLLTPAPGGIRAVNLADGKLLWAQAAPAKLCGIEPGCSAGQGGPFTAIPGAVLSGGMDGGLRAYSTENGAPLWTFDTNKDFDTVNGIKAHGGSMDSAGPIVVDGMLYVSSGSVGVVGRQGNVLLAFGLPEGKNASAHKPKNTNCAPFCKD